ncbi:MAG: AMIN domain-containing protein, partial [Gallionella sp.]
MFNAVIKLVTLFFIFWLPQGHATTVIHSARVWPAQDYTRLTLESKHAIRHNMFKLNKPERLVIDLEQVEFGSALNNLPKLIGNDDPYIKSVRVGRFKRGVVRLVLDLKSAAKP